MTTRPSVTHAAPRAPGFRALLTSRPLALAAMAAASLGATACSHGGASTAAAGPAIARVAAPVLAPNAPQKMSGCYAIKMSPWSTKTLGVYVAPPGPFRLDTLAGAPGDDGALTLRAEAVKVKDAGRYGQYQLAAWRPVGLDSVDIAWANDSHGLTMRLGPVQADTLTGEAEAWTNFTMLGREVSRSEVRVWRMKCT